MAGTRNSWLRSFALGALVVGIAVAGIATGRYLRRTEEPVHLAPGPPTHRLPIGHRFPTVALLDEQEAPLVTDDLWRERGAIVLFLDFDCAPCGSMVDRWQALAGSDSLAGLPVVGITLATPEAIRTYRAAHQVAFPIHADTAAAFMNVHGVTNFPLCATVSRSGVLQRARFDPNEAIQARELIAVLER